MTRQPQKQRVIQISIKWTNQMKTRAPLPSPQIKPEKTRSPLGDNTTVFLFGTAAMAPHTTNNKQPQDEDTTVCSYETQLLLHQRIMKYNRCKPTATIRHQIWLKSQSPNNNEQTVSLPRTVEWKKLFQFPNQGVQQPTEEIIRLIFNNNKPEKIQNSRRGSSSIKLRTNTTKPRQKRHLRTLRTQDTILTSYHPISSVIR